jgi:hypothetical protein
MTGRRTTEWFEDGPLRRATVEQFRSEGDRIMSRKREAAALYYELNAIRSKADKLIDEWCAEDDREFDGMASDDLSNLRYADDHLANAASTLALIAEIEHF